MPHLTIEYSENLAENIEISKLVKVMHDSAASIEALPLGGLRTRASRREFYLIADGDSSNTFVNVVLRIAPGRSDEVKKQAGEKLFSALKDFFDLFFQSSPIALSLEIQELDANLRWKDSNIREHMKKRSP
ncbi:MAG: 5-carboxymethyl-2-hydroxymuconate isomerase [Woeseiaceae bacterium]|nr:5-carboxymethyl-2-hydroxymuconate isomerase [Woeseiaceae bacterium]|tara:strand:- start:3427 stop:3819 length:393 start_codon:yes stop_codon:yes gene_type:complete